MIKRVFTAVALTCVTAASMTAQNYNPTWERHFKAVEKNTESSLTMTVMATIDGERCDSAFEIGVFCGDECRVSMPFFSSGNYIEKYGYYSKLTVKGEAGEKLSFRLYDHRNQVEVVAEEYPDEITFTSDKHYGSLNTGLYELAFGSSATHRSSLVLEDRKDLPFSGELYGTAAGGIACTYTRNAYLDGGFESIVLPFDADVTAAKEAGFSFEKFGGFGTSTICFVELADGEKLKAGKAYIFRYTGVPSDGEAEITFTGTPQRVSDGIIAQEGWTGTFHNMDGNAIAGKYILNVEGDMMQRAGSGASLASYRAYLELPENVDAASLSVEHRGETTTIENLQSKENGSAIYDLSGRKLKEMPKSGIVIMNNKKIYIK